MLGYGDDMCDFDYEKYKDIIDKDYDVKTVGDLKRVLESMPDDWTLVKTVDEEVVDITFIQTYFHGAIEF